MKNCVGHNKKKVENLCVGAQISRLEVTSAVRPTQLSVILFASVEKSP